MIYDCSRGMSCSAFLQNPRVVKPGWFWAWSNPSCCILVRSHFDSKPFGRRAQDLVCSRRACASCRLMDPVDMKENTPPPPAPPPARQLTGWTPTPPPYPPPSYLVLAPRASAEALAASALLRCYIEEIFVMTDGSAGYGPSGARMASAATETLQTAVQEGSTRSSSGTGNGGGDTDGNTEPPLKCRRQS
jgi:hypothetical protein